MTKNTLYQLISKPHPRKGTETRLAHDLDILINAHFKTTSPQGDGNLSAVLIILPLVLISKPHPRKGTETTLLLLLSYWQSYHISKPHPRKGTETCTTFARSRRIYTEFQNHIPARGRKQSSLASDEDRSSVFQNHIPARGRKPYLINPNLVGIAVISKPHPRKGTETQYHERRYNSNELDFKTTSPQGDGNP